MTREIRLSAEQWHQLEELAARERRSVDEVVQLAVDAYTARRARDWSEWGCRFDDLAARVREHMPAGVTPEDIEADITDARSEVRLETRRAADEGGPSPGADAPKLWQ